MRSLDGTELEAREILFSSRLQRAFTRVSSASRVSHTACFSHGVFFTRRVPFAFPRIQTATHTKHVTPLPSRRASSPARNGRIFPSSLSPPLSLLFSFCPLFNRELPFKIGIFAVNRSKSARAAEHNRNAERHRESSSIDAPLASSSQRSVGR